MWLSPKRDLPAINEQVIGILLHEDGFDGVAWWTLTDDGWYASDTRGNIGHRDAMSKESSEGPDYWQHAPKNLGTPG